MSVPVLHLEIFLFGQLGKILLVPIRYHRLDNGLIVSLLILDLVHERFHLDFSETSEERHHFFEPILVLFVLLIRGESVQVGLTDLSFELLGFLVNALKQLRVDELLVIKLRDLSLRILFELIVMVPRLACQFLE